MTSKDEELTYEELAALCRKQEEYIIELKERLKAPTNTLKCEPAKPDYDELFIRNEYLSDRNREQEDIIQALLHSLQKINIERLVSDNESRHFKEMWGKEHKRAEKLFDEINKVNDK